MHSTQQKELIVQLFIKLPHLSIADPHPSMGTLAELQTLEGHSDRVWHVAWSPTGALEARQLPHCQSERLPCAAVGRQTSSGCPTKTCGLSASKLHKA